ncbi:MAG: hypothetical protein V3U82_01975 [Robiginitomaculum sp.]
MDPDNKIEGYIAPTDAQIAARKKRNLAIGGALGGFCALVFVLMIFKIKSMGVAV